MSFLWRSFPRFALCRSHAVTQSLTLPLVFFPLLSPAPVHKGHTTSGYTVLPVFVSCFPGSLLVLQSETTRGPYAYSEYQ